MVDFLKRRIAMRVVIGIVITSIPSILLVVITASVPFQQHVSAQESTLSLEATSSAREIMDFEKQVEAAVLRADIPFLDSVCSDDFTYTHGDGWTTGGSILSVDTKSQWLGSLTGRYSAREVDSQHAEIHGDVAITMGRVRARFDGHEDTQRTFSFWYIRVYEQRQGRWRYLSHRTVHGPIYND
mgnify:CR=1 FL=1